VRPQVRMMPYRFFPDDFTPVVKGEGYFAPNEAAQDRESCRETGSLGKERSSDLKSSSALRLKADLCRAFPGEIYSAPHRECGA